MPLVCDLLPLFILKAFVKLEFIRKYSLIYQQIDEDYQNSTKMFLVKFILLYTTACRSA